MAASLSNIEVQVDSEKQQSSGRGSSVVSFPESDRDSVKVCEIVPLVDDKEYESETEVGHGSASSDEEQTRPSSNSGSTLGSSSPMCPKYTYREHVFIVSLAMVLSFNSGFSNGISLSGFLTPPGAMFDRQSTSGYTGVYTASALALHDPVFHCWRDHFGLDESNKKNLWKLPILLGLAVSFWLGGLISFFAVKAWRGYTLLVNAAIFLLLFCVIVTFLVKSLHLPVHEALNGTWHWQRTMHKLKFRTGDGTTKSNESPADIFNAIDSDRNGAIGTEEFSVGLQRAGIGKISRSKILAMFEVCDKNGDGEISLQEFRDLTNGENVLVG